jgi:hypothetical protein
LSYNCFYTGDVATHIIDGMPILKILGHGLTPQTEHLLLQLVQLSHSFVRSQIAYL